MKKRTASCCCGQLQVTTAGEPLRVAVCHCHACQRRTGSAFGAQARFKASQASITGEASRYTRSADSGNQVLHYFCPECGSTVYYRFAGDSESLVIPLGAFAGAELPAPEFSVYESRRHDWVELADGVTRYD